MRPGRRPGARLARLALRPVTGPLARRLRLEVEVEDDVLHVLARLGPLTVGRVVVGPVWRTIGLPESFASGGWVHPLLREAGLGRRLLARALDETFERGTPEVHAHLRMANERSLAMCRSVGFELVDRPDLQRAIEAALRERTGHDLRQAILRVERPA